MNSLAEADGLLAFPDLYADIVREPEQSGWVYVATNESMPGLVKIGMTRTAPETRVAALANGSVPTPFTLVGAVASDRPVALEAKTHRRLCSRRVNLSREFFALTPDEALLTVREQALEMEETPEVLTLSSDLAQIGNQLRALRQAAGFTQLQLGERVGLTRQTVIKAERGQEVLLSIFLRLLAGLEISLDLLNAAHAS